MRRRQFLALAGGGSLAGLAGCLDTIAGLRSPDLRAGTPEEAVKTFWNAVEEEDRDVIVAVTEGISDLYFEALDIDDYDEFMEREVEPISDWALLEVDGDLTIEEIVEDKIRPRDGHRLVSYIRSKKRHAERTADDVGATDYGFVYVNIATNAGPSQSFPNRRIN